MLEDIYRQGVRILKASIAIVSNRKSLLLSFPLPLEVKSLLTDFKEVEEIPFPADPDGRIIVHEIPGGRPSCRVAGTRAVFRGPFVSLTRRSSDLRYSLWGNQGFLYRFSLYLLGKKHRIHSLHACGLFDRARNRLYVVAGGAGSGKTVYLLSGLEKGLELFSTETVPFTFAGRRVIWFMGSLVDNVRLETLRRHFPRFLPSSLPSSPSVPRQDKIAVDLSSYRCPEETLCDPEVVILFPRVEEGRRSFQISPAAGPAHAERALFDNIAEKLAGTVVLYDRLAVPGLDDAELAAARLRAVGGLVQKKRTRLIASILSSPGQCWGNLLSRRF
ncbi:MAG: hypothetical protein FJY81_03155 [Candidatus Aminicenantes bacterium]|nr:hypothetical protein [Candidatus Aminicenantes bacterium]